VTAGLSATGLANVWLDELDTLAPWLKLHTGDPGSAGTANASAETTRKAITYAAASAGSKAANGTLPSWASWSAGTETITHVSRWSASTAGTFRDSIALGTPRTVANGETLNTTTLTTAQTPIAS
jgi:hypothetical protein